MDHIVRLYTVKYIVVWDELCHITLVLVLKHCRWYKVMSKRETEASDTKSCQNVKEDEIVSFKFKMQENRFKNFLTDIRNIFLQMSKILSYNTCSQKSLSNGPSQPRFSHGSISIPMWFLPSPCSSKALFKICICSLPIQFPENFRRIAVNFGIISGPPAEIFNFYCHSCRLLTCFNKLFYWATCKDQYIRLPNSRHFTWVLNARLSVKLQT